MKTIKNIYYKIQNISFPQMYIKLLKITFLLSALYFLFYQFKDITFSKYTSISVSSLLFSLLLLFLATSLFAYSWYLSLGLNSIPSSKIIKYYFQGQLGKYIPGSIWSIAGRVGLATTTGLSAKDATKKTILHLLKLWGTCFLVGFATYVSNINLYIIFLLLIIFIGVNYKETFLYLIAWLIIPTSYVLIFLSLGLNNNIEKIFSSSTLSWLGGFLFIPAPSGIGVREYLFTVIYNNSNVLEELLVVSGAIRLLTILNDLFGFLIYSALDKFKKE